MIHEKTLSRQYLEPHRAIEGGGGGQEGFEGAGHARGLGGDGHRRAAVTIAAETSGMSCSLESLLSAVNALDGAVRFEILAG